MVNNRLRFNGIMIIVLLFIILVFGTNGTQAKPNKQFDDDIAQGEYIANVAGCISCHTPFQERYNDLANLPLEEVREFVFNEEIAADRTRLLAGGRYFDLGPAGGVVSRNITPDEATGIGNWTDEDIETAVRYGVSKDGHQLFPLMPYNIFRNMAASDMEALIAYLRSIPPVENETEHPEHLPTAPSLGPTNFPQTPPDPSDTTARADYLMSGVLACTDCHTPLDPETGAPVMENYLAGGQPYEGPWGIVYAGNLTPHESGIGDWTDEEIKRAIYSGIKRDGRRLVLMPWAAFSALTAEDADAIIYHLRNIPAVQSQAPAASIAPEFEDYVNLSDMDGTTPAGNIAPVILIILAILVAGGIMLLNRQ